jgi:hypothetical protein
MKHLPIKLKKDRKPLELFNALINFCIQQFKLLAKMSLAISLPVIAITWAVVYMPSSFFDSSLYKDMSHIIALQTYHVGINPAYTLLTGYIVSIIVCAYIKLYEQQMDEEPTTIKDVYTELKPQLFSLLSLAMVLTLLFLIAISLLIYMDTDFRDMFGFSLFYLTYPLVPILAYTNMSIIYFTINEDSNVLEAIKKSKTSFGNFLSTWLSVAIVVVVLYIIKLIVMRLLFTTVIAFSLSFNTLDAVGMFGIKPITQFVYFSLLIFFSLYIVFMQKNYEAKRGSNDELLKRIEDIQ